MEHIAFVIEDNPDISNLFSRALVAAGFQVSIIPDGKEAILRLKEESPSLIVLDMNMPYIDGGTVLTYIRATKHLKEAKVIIATADSQMSDFHCHKADLCLQKPVTFSQLRDFAERCKSNPVASN
jgi:CheY-like chemotaxis protein